MKQGLKRILCASIFLLVGLVALLAWRLWITSEPSYGGKKLTAWIEQWRSNRSEWLSIPHAPMPEAGKDAEEAIVRIGSKGIPYLLRLIRTKESATTLRLKRALPEQWLGWLGLVEDEDELNEIGSQGLYILGTNASPAVPALMDLLSAELARSPVDAKRIRLLMSPLSSMKDGADPAIPVLIECLTNTNNFVRREAARCLGRFYHKPGIVVPALLKYLSLQNQPDRLEEGETIISLGMFGTNAALAAPAVTGYLSDPDPTFRKLATNWLRRVDPSAAERAGIRINQSR